MQTALCLVWVCVLSVNSLVCAPVIISFLEIHAVNLQKCTHSQSTQIQVADTCADEHRNKQPTAHPCRKGFAGVGILINCVIPHGRGACSWWALCWPRRTSATRWGHSIKRWRTKCRRPLRAHQHANPLSWAHWHVRESWHQMAMRLVEPSLLQFTHVCVSLSTVCVWVSLRLCVSLQFPYPNLQLL